MNTPTLSHCPLCDSPTKVVSVGEDHFIRCTNSECGLESDVFPDPIAAILFWNDLCETLGGPLVEILTEPEPISENKETK